MRFRKAAPDKAKVKELLSIVHLEEFAERRPHELSGGMQQRAALARALAQDADILLDGRTVRRPRRHDPYRAPR